jgi:hypothetical protein
MEGTEMGRGCRGQRSGGLPSTDRREHEHGTRRLENVPMPVKLRLQELDRGG